MAEADSLPSSDVSTTSTRGVAARNFVLDNAIWFILLAMCILASIVNPVFLSKTNLLNLLLSVAVLGVLTVGESLVLFTGNFDLSIESTVGFSAAVAAWLMLGPPTGSGLYLSPVLAIVVMLALGAAIGLFNGFMVVRVGMNPFIVTLAMLIILRGAMLILTSGQALYNLPKGFTFLGSGSIGGINYPAVILIIAFIIAHIVASRHPFGRALFAIGGNRSAAVASGIDADRTVVMVFVISGILAAFAGLLLAGRLEAVVTNLGQGMVFDVMAAAVIGGVSLNGGRGTMIGALGGVILLGVIGNSLTLAQVSSFWVDTIRGLLILVAMVIDAMKTRLR